MNPREAIKRAVATAVQSFLAVVLAAGFSGTVADLALVQQAGVAALTAALTLAHRGVQSYLERTGGQSWTWGEK